MGVFLAEPITNALNEALTASAALAEVRRVLELIVPLAYRPPIKACALSFTVMLALIWLDTVTQTVVIVWESIRGSCFGCHANGGLILLQCILHARYLVGGVPHLVARLASLPRQNAEAGSLLSVVC